MLSVFCCAILGGSSDKNAASSAHTLQVFSMSEESSAQDSYDPIPNAIFFNWATVIVFLGPTRIRIV